MTRTFGHAASRRPPRASGLSLIYRALLSLAALTWIAAAAAPAAAQTTLGTIRGTVLDQQQGIVPGATVVATDEESIIARHARVQGNA